MVLGDTPGSGNGTLFGISTLELNTEDLPGMSLATTGAEAWSSKLRLTGSGNLHTGNISINGATTISAINSNGNIRLQAGSQNTSIRGVNYGVGIVFPDGSYQYTANIGSGGPGYLEVKKDGANVNMLTTTMNFTGNGITVTKDGVTVAKSIDLFDPSENLAVKMMKEAAERTATSAGDGTTTAIVLTEGLVLGGLEHIKPHHNRTEVLRSMVEISDKVVENLKKKSNRYDIE
jgi:hypothetical protein